VQGREATDVWRLGWRNQWNGQKLKERLRCEAQGGSNARSLSKEKADAAMSLRLAPNPCALATMQHPRGDKIMTSKRRKSPKQRSCFHFRIEGYGSYRHVNHLFRTTLSAPNS